MPKVLRKPAPTLVISVHGIRTRAEWQKALSSVLRGIPTASYDYGRYSLLKFLSPWTNDAQIDKFYDWYSDTVRSNSDLDLNDYRRLPSCVAHSFGTWIVGMTMLKYSDVRFDRIIFSGGILPVDFDWATLFARDQVAAVWNECGGKDPWPRWARRLVPRTGTSGRDGFNWYASAVKNEHLEGFDHGDFHHQRHMEQSWIPFLTKPSPKLAVLHGRQLESEDEFYRLFDDTFKIDREAYGNLDNYGEVELGPDRAITWIGTNPDIYTFLIDRGMNSAVGYFNAMPIEDQLYDSIKRGLVTDEAVESKDILPFDAKDYTRIYLMSVAISKKYRNVGQGLFHQSYVKLLTGFLDKLVFYAKNHRVMVTHFLAAAWTQEGHRICESFGMKKIGKDRVGNDLYELDVISLLKRPSNNLTPAMRRLLRAYKNMKRPVEPAGISRPARTK